MSDTYKSAFFVIPSHIMDLPDITLAFIKVYETIFQFWNHKKDCYLSNQKIMERTNIKSERTIQAAFSYFEKHGELKRVTQEDCRYLISPESKIRTENITSTSSNTEKFNTIPPAMDCYPPPQWIAG